MASTSTAGSAAGPHRRTEADRATGARETGARETDDRATDDRGASSLEVLVLFPLLLLLVMGLIAGALGYHARNVALAAADEGLRSATREDGDPAAGASAAVGFLARSGGGSFLPDAQVSASGTAEQVTVTVRGTSLSLVPGLPGIPVEQTASGPRERFTGS